MSIIQNCPIVQYSTTELDPKWTIPFIQYCPVIHCPNPAAVHNPGNLGPSTAGVISLSLSLCPSRAYSTVIKIWLLLSISLPLTKIASITGAHPPTCGAYFNNTVYLATLLRHLLLGFCASLVSFPTGSSRLISHCSCNKLVTSSTFVPFPDHPTDPCQGPTNTGRYPPTDPRNSASSLDFQVLGNFPRVYSQAAPHRAASIDTSTCI